jgi:hypothetical protein
LKACIGLGQTHLLGLELVEVLVGKYVSSHIVVSWDVLKLNPLNVALEFIDFSTIGINHILDAIPLLVDLLDDDLGMPKASSRLMPRDTAIRSL